MGKDRKTFIDRKNAITFHLVHRSQHDPLVTDETAPQHVLVEASKRHIEQRKFGILYDDEYDYLQHLKKPEQEVVWEYVENPNQARRRIDEDRLTTAPKLNFPSSVFASEFEEEEGMLNKAAPQPGPRPDWDADVVAALDDDFDFSNEENQLEDDFILKAMKEPEEGDSTDEWGYVSNAGESEDDKDKDDDDYGMELMDRLAPLIRDQRFCDEETKSRFTEYSISSSVIRRNEQLTLLDDRFERFYATYDDPELGDLSMEDIEGTWHQKHPYVLGCFKEFKKSKKLEDYNKEWDQERLQKYRNVVDGKDDPNEELVEYEVNDPKEKKWDCESIRSTYSNIYNYPKVIDEPQHRNKITNCEQTQKIEIDCRTGLPLHVLRDGDNSQLTAKMLAALDNSKSHTGDKVMGPKSLCAKSVISALSVLSIRPRNETTDEKKDRKRLLKDYRMERRIEKKANAHAFKEEKKRQTLLKINQHTYQNGSKIL